MANILVTAIGSMSANCVISNLRKLNHNVFGCDIYPSEWHLVSKKCVDVYRSPLATNTEEYITFILDLAKKLDLTYIFPLTDIEIDTIAKYRNKFEENNIVVCISKNETLEICRNKEKLHHFFTDDTIVLSIPTLNIEEMSSFMHDNKFPYIAKPKNGRSSEGITIINNENELTQVINDKNYIIQKFLKGNIYTVDLVRNPKNGATFCIPREELLRTKNGAGLTVKVENNISLIELSIHIAQKLNISGCVNMEYISYDKKYYLIDINPRFSAGIAFSNLLGYDFIESHLNCFTNKDILPSIEFKDQIISKNYFEEILVTY